MRIGALFCGALVLVSPRLGGSVPASTPALGDLSKVGTVHLPVSCDPSVQKGFDRGLALLHSFFYEEARREFRGVAAVDPGCAMAHWGIAMTLWHPIWTPPDAAELKEGLAAVEKAKAIGGKTELEKAYIDAIASFYSTAADPSPTPGAPSCHGLTAGDHRSRALAYEKKMEEIYAHRPDDVEVGTLYALALLGTAVPTDKTLSNQTKATSILEKFYRSNGDHPGIAHYLIHGYDYPPVALKGLPAAKAYAAMAPWVPHALHMPSHIFVRLGMWKETIDANLASRDAAQKYAARNHPDAVSFEELHANDYLAYGYLQTGDDAKAKEVTDRIASVRKTHPEVDFVSAYALGAVPARYALERHQWTEAASLVLPASPHFARFPFGQAHVEFARAIGLARLGRVAEAKDAAAKLQKLAESMNDPKQEYFKKQVLMQSQLTMGSIAWAEGKNGEAETILRAAAETDDALGKHPVSPGSLIPAREVLGDFLLAIGRPKDALEQHRASLVKSPKRFNGLYGAGRAAELAGEKAAARRFYEELVAQGARDSKRQELQAARAFLKKK